MKTNEPSISVLENHSQFLEYNRDGSALIVDIRNKEDFALGHIENAIHSDIMSQNFVRFFFDADKTTPVILYCTDGSRSKIATRILNEMGFESVSHLIHGLKNWDGPIKSDLDQ